MTVAINKVFNYARMTTATTGTGTITLGAAVAPYLTFAQAGVSDGDVVYYSIIDGTSNVECGIGTYTAVGTTLSRTTVLRSSGASNTAKISLSGSAEVHIEFLADGTTGNMAIKAGQIVGTTTNDDANAGNVGELISANVASGSAVALTTGAIANVTSVTLTAGDWDITGAGGFLPAASTSITRWGQSIETTNSAFSSIAPNSWITSMAAVVPGAAANIFALPVLRVSISTSTTYYLNAVAVFTVSTLGAYGFLRARRLR